MGVTEEVPVCVADKVGDEVIVMADEADNETVLVEVMEDELEIIDETVYEDFAVSEVDTDMKEEPLAVMDDVTEAIVVDVGVSFDVKLPPGVFDSIKDGLIDDDPLTDEELE